METSHYASCGFVQTYLLQMVFDLQHQMNELLISIRKLVLILCQKCRCGLWKEKLCYFANGFFMTTCQNFRNQSTSCQQNLEKMSQFYHTKCSFRLQVSANTICHLVTLIIFGDKFWGTWKFKGKALEVAVQFGKM